MIKKTKQFFANLSIYGLYRKGTRKIALLLMPRNVRAGAYYLNTYNFIIKKFRKEIYGNLILENMQKPNDTIWICWLQGLENAPDLVKACVNSIKQKINNKKVVIITEKNLAQYIELPKYIIEKKNKGIISNTHFSDIIRTELLCKYGGIWIDSTVLCTASAHDFEVIMNVPFFVYKSVDLSQIKPPINLSSWLIVSDGNSKILHLTRKLLYAYWKKYNYLDNYLLFHIFFTICSEKYPEEYNDIPTFNNISPHIMQRELGNTYSEERWNDYLSVSSFHKLTYKIDLDKDKNTNYKHIVDNYLRSDN